MRGVLLGSFAFGWMVDVVVLFFAGLAMFYIGSKSFDRMSLG